MTATTSAESDSKEKDSQDVAHPEGESQGEKPGDDWIKKSQFLAALNDVTRKLDTVSSENRELKAALAKKEEVKTPPPTRDELLRLVGTGDLTQAQADQIWEKQVIERATAKAAAEVDQRIGAQEHARRVQAELSGYKELVPAAWEQGSPERLKAEREYTHLTKVAGLPEGPETEAIALRIAFGDLTVLRASQSARSGPADTHSETGGSKPGDGEKKDGPVKGLTPAQKEYYEKGIKAGRYKDWKDVKAELEYSNPRKRA